MAADSTIYSVAIGTNRNAPAECSDINMYRTSADGENLSLGQLVAAVSIRTAAALEARSVLNLNRLADKTEFSKALSNAIQQLTATTGPDGKDAVVKWTDPVKLPEGYHPISDDFAKKNTLWNFFVCECKVEQQKLPKDLDTLKNRLAAFAIVRPAVENVLRFSQMQQIEADTAVKRRDTALQTAGNVIKQLSGSMLGQAAAMRVR